MHKTIIPFLFIILTVQSAFSQAGRGIYKFLDLPVSSRLAALGGSNVSLNDNDINFGFQNPALLTAETHNTIGINMANYLADIKFGSAVYGRTIGTKNYLAVGIQYIDYGLFKETTVQNEIIGEFTAKDLAINIIYARPLSDKYSVGATLKPVYSVYERYTSYGLAMDLGASYKDTANLFSAGLVLRNIGTQLKGYYADENGQHLESLPFNIQLGMTKKFKHAPLRLSFTLNDLQQWNLAYQSTNQPTETTATATDTKKISFADMFFRHTIFAAEFVPTKNFYLAIGYNHRRQKEMNMNGFKSSAGFSFGGGVKIYKFQTGFGMSQFQAGNYSYQFSITTNLNEFRL